VKEKNFSATSQRIIEYFTQKIVIKLLKILVWDPGSENLDPEKKLFRIKKAPDTGPRLRIRNTARSVYGSKDPDPYQNVTDPDQ
jgi:hypothetical protein